MNILDSKINGVKIIETSVFRDFRGSFTRFFCESELASVLAGRRIVQINHSHNEKAGTLRGLHFQRSPHAEMKLVRCIRGKIWDVAVDLRVGSPTFKGWHAEELTPENARMLVIPEGCAHGFQSLEPGSELVYCVTHPYTPAADSGVRHDDPALAISWPEPVTAISDKDQMFALMGSDFPGIAL